MSDVLCILSCAWHDSLHIWASDLLCIVSVCVLESVQNVWYDCSNVALASDVSEHELASDCNSAMQMSDVGAAVTSCASVKGGRKRVYVGDLVCWLHYCASTLGHQSGVSCPWAHDSAGLVCVARAMFLACPGASHFCACDGVFNLALIGSSKCVECMGDDSFLGADYSCEAVGFPKGPRGVDCLCIGPHNIGRVAPNHFEFQM
eukprot:5424921-Amphidinium_carterae.1